MDSAPTIEETCHAIATLYYNPDRGEKEKASIWLQDFQKSVHAWKVSDELLHRKLNVESCYIAAQTMRTKIQTSFYELPVDAHNSLKESLLEHIGSIDEHTETVIVVQLCLALADLVLVMPSWTSAVEDLIRRYSRSRPWALLEFLLRLPEEVTSLRLGANRREELLGQFKKVVPEMNQFLTICLNSSHRGKHEYKPKVFNCFTSWLQLELISLHDIESNDVIESAFKVLASLDESADAHETAADVICALLEMLNPDEDPGDDMLCLEMNVLAAVLNLEPCYLAVRELEDLDRSHNFCRVFTELAETFLTKIVVSSNPGSHFAMPVFNAVVACCSQNDYEIADVTFNLWYRLAEEVYEKQSESLIATFRPYVERLINALCKHCQIEPGTEGLLEEGNDFADFRFRVLDLLREVIFIAGQTNVFKHMLQHLSGASTAPTSWEVTEAALFIMQATARNLDPSVDESVSHVLISLLNVPDTAHIAIRHTSIKLVGELCVWISKHPEFLERILNWILVVLQDSLLSSAAAHTLHNICSECKSTMWPHFQGLVHIMRSVDNFKLKPKASNELLKGLADILSFVPNDKIQVATGTLCSLQVEPLQTLIGRHRSSHESGVSINKNTTSDPVLYLDRLSVIFLNIKTSRSTVPGAVHPCLAAATGVWPALNAIFDTFPSDERIMERCSRTMRFMVRSLGVQSISLLQLIIERIVHVYQAYSHSCFLYLGSVLVDEFSRLPECLPKLMGMLNAFIKPTFLVLNEIEAMRARPDTVEDFFRLNARFLQRATLPYLKSPFLNEVISCGLLATSLDHQDANSAVLKFFCDLLRAGRTRTDRPDFRERADFINHLKHEFGAKLISCLIRATVFTLPSYTCNSVGCVIFELMSSDKPTVCNWLESSLRSLPGGSTSLATTAQVFKFYKAVAVAEEEKQTSDAVFAFSQLWR